MNQYKLYKRAWVYADEPQLESKLPKKTIKQMLKSGGIMVRNCYDFDCVEETFFWYVIKDSFGGLEELSSKCRNKVRKSQKIYDYRLVTVEELKESGYDVIEKYI